MRGDRCNNGCSRYFDVVFVRMKIPKTGLLTMVSDIVLNGRTARILISRIILSIAVAVLVQKSIIN